MEDARTRRARVCEYCGCQALATIEELTREHDAALDLMRTARTAITVDDLPAVRGLCRQLLLLLEPHNAVEEQALFVAMHEENPEHVDVLLAEHRLIHEVLDDLAHGAASKDRPSPLSDALHTLREHISKEQDGLFPAALATLSTAQWEAAERVRSAVGSALSPTRGTS